MVPERLCRHLSEQLMILGMNELHHEREAHGFLWGPQAEEAVLLVGPDARAAGQVEGPASDLGEPLCLSQQRLTVKELVFDALLLGDVDVEVGEPAIRQWIELAEGP